MTGDQTPDAPSVRPAPPRSHDRLLYDWMVNELLAMADEMRDSGIGRGLQRNLMGTVVVSVAEYVSSTRGSGSFKALPWLREHRDA